VGRLLDSARGADRWAARLVEDLIGVVESGATDDALGVAVEVVLSQSARLVRFERTTLLRAVTALRAMPSTRQALREGWISFGQVKTIVTAVRRVDVAGRDQVDALVDRLAVSSADMVADALVSEVDWLVDQLVADRDANKANEPGEINRLIPTPRLDGSGTLFGDYDPDHFPLVMARPDDQIANRHHLEPDPDDLHGDGLSDRELTDAHRHAWHLRSRNAARRAAALFELVTGLDATTLAPLDNDGSRTGGRVKVSATCNLATLLDGTTPAWVLNRLGGRIQVTSTTARRWIEAFGADTNLFLFDDVGEVIGHGHTQRWARGTLRDAIIARDLHDTAPCSTTPAALCDVDHIAPWDPSHPAGGGPTDAPNLILLSRRWHTAKTRGHWILTRHPDGTRTWTNTRSGYRVRQARPPHTRRGTPPDHGPDP